MFSGTEPWILVTSTPSVSSSMIHIPNILRPSNSPVFATWSKLYIGASTRSLRRGRRSKITYHFFTRQPSDGAQLPPSAMVRAGMGWDNRRHPPLHLAPPSPAGLFHASSLDVQQHVDRRDEFGAGLPVVGHDALDGAGLHRVAYLEGDAATQPRDLSKKPLADVAPRVLVRAMQDDPHSIGQTDADARATRLPNLTRTGVASPA